MISQMLHEGVFENLLNPIAVNAAFRIVEAAFDWTPESIWYAMEAGQKVLDTALDMAIQRPARLSPGLVQRFSWHQ